MLNFSYKPLICMVFFSVVSAVVAAERDFPALQDGQQVALSCKIVERNVNADESFTTGDVLGSFRLLGVQNDKEFPAEAQFLINEEASLKYDLYYFDRYPSTLQPILASEVEASTSPDAEQTKAVLKFFKSLAGIAEETEVFAYLFIADAQGLALNVTFLDKDKKILGHGGILYNQFPFACLGFSGLKEGDSNEGAEPPALPANEILQGFLKRFSR